MFTVCTQPRRAGLLDGDIHAAIVERLTEATDKSRCLVPIYTLMPDHFHLIIQGHRDDSDSLAAMVAFRLTFGIWMATNGPRLHLQKDFHDHIIRRLEGWKDEAWYIANNPVRKRFAEHAFDWPFTGSIGRDLRETLG